MKHLLLVPALALIMVSSHVIAQSETANDPVAIILQDHKNIRLALGDIEKNLDSNTKEARSKFKELQEFVIKHEKMEQKWYPSLEKDAKLKGIIAGLIKEENDAAKELKRIDGIKDDKEWAKNVRAIAKAIDHHASEEETKLLPEVRKSFNKAALYEMGTKMQDFRKSNNMKG